MKEASEVKYLGDILNSHGNPKATISERINRGYAICGQIFALLRDIPLGSLRVQIGLELRKAWLVNGIIFNSEVWHSVTDSDIAPFVEIDKYLLKGLLTAHAKTPLEHIYLETAALPIPYIITTRRLIYLKHILDRSDTEVTNKIYRCQKANPSPGDWCNLVDQDFKDIELDITEDFIKTMPLLDYKALIKSTARKAAFKSLEAKKASHSKVNQNKYVDMKNPQGYLTDKSITNTQCSILFALRSHCVRGIKENFKILHSENTLCPLCERCIDTQFHILQCKVLQDILPLTEDISYSDIYGTTQSQIDFVRIYEQYLVLRDEILEDTDPQASIPAIYAGPRHHQIRRPRIGAALEIHKLLMFL